jgi:hypothetical protein
MVQTLYVRQHDARTKMRSIKGDVRDGYTALCEATASGDPEDLKAAREQYREAIEEEMIWVDRLSVGLNQNLKFIPIRMSEAEYREEFWVFPNAVREQYERYEAAYADRNVDRSRDIRMWLLGNVVTEDVPELPVFLRLRMPVAPHPTLLQTLDILTKRHLMPPELDAYLAYRRKLTEFDRESYLETLETFATVEEVWGDYSRDTL